MADSLREAAEAVVERYHIWVHREHSGAALAESIGNLKDALSAPDPVSEAREIIEEFYVDTADEDDLCLKARDWLKRHGGSSEDQSAENVGREAT